VGMEGEGLREEGEGSGKEGEGRKGNGKSTPKQKFWLRLWLYRKMSDKWLTFGA